MSNLVIVAIPDENDRVWKVSSEKIPHLTLLFLGDVDTVSNVDQIVQFVEHAANTTLGRFYLPVDRRGELGADQADVLFFKKGRYDYKAVRDFRAQLLKDNNIRTAYDSAEQFEGPWNPHLTLGYPTDPAKPDETDRDFGFYDVAFNKVAVWMGDFEGPEFLLKDPWDEWDALETVPMDVAMSDIDPARAAALEHFGIKGMHWGVRKDDASGGGKTATARTGVSKAAGATSRFVKDVNFESNVESGKARERLIDAASKDFRDKDLSAINSKPEHQKAKSLKNRLLHPRDPQTKAYRTEVKTAYIKRLETTANSMTNATGDRQYTIRERGIELPAQGGELPKSKYFWDVSSRKIKHADGTEDVTTVEVLLDDDGFITDTKLVKNEMAQTADLGAAFLAHHGLGEALNSDRTAAFLLEHYGVKGMHWGVRKEKPDPAPVTPKAQSHVPAGTRRRTKIEVQGGENHPAHEDAIKVAEAQAKLQKSGTSALSNNELKEVQERLNLERNVTQLVESTGRIAKGRSFVKGVISPVKDANDALNTGLQTMRLVKQLR